MPILADRLRVRERRATLIQGCVALVEHQVQVQPTLRRQGLKAGIAVLDAINPNALHLVVSDLLDEFTRALPPPCTSCTTRPAGAILATSSRTTRTRQSAH